METRADIDYYINFINTMYDDFVEYADSLEYTDSDEKTYSISDTLVENTKKSVYTSLQYLEEQKKNSLQEFSHTVISDTTIIDLCFELYKEVNEENIETLYTANDLYAYNRSDIDPNNPIILKGTVIKYYK
jgi:hypothetical protein